MGKPITIPLVKQDEWIETMLTLNHIQAELADVRRIVLELAVDTDGALTVELMDGCKIRVSS